MTSIDHVLRAVREQMSLNATTSTAVAAVATFEQLKARIEDLFVGSGIDVRVTGNNRFTRITLPEDLFDHDELDGLMQIEGVARSLGWYVAIEPEIDDMAGDEYHLYPANCFPVKAPPKVYHLTTSAGAGKALVEGLRLSRGRRAHHHKYPPRVYVYREPPKGEGAPWDLGLGDDYAVLEIDTATVPGLELCHDRQLDPYESVTHWEGAYSERPIPAAALRRIR